MSKKTFFKIIIAILIGILLFITLSQNTFGVKDISTMFDGTQDKSNASNKMQDILGATINIVQVISTGFAIVMLVVLGIRFLWESPSGKAEFKKKIRVYILGAILIFAAVGLLGIVKRFAVTNINGQVNSATNTQNLQGI